MTQLFVAHQNAESLVAVAPSYGLLAVPFVIGGIACWVGGVFLAVTLKSRTGVAFRPGLWVIIPLLVAVSVGTPLVYVGLLTARATRVTILPDSNQLTVQQTVLSFPVSTRVYSLDLVRRVLIGVGLNCTSLQAVMTDGHAETLISCTDRTGYSEVAESINRYLDAHRASPQQ
jgi:hypothetical protein